MSAPDYPDIKVELYSENGMRNIVEKRFDAGVRLGRREIAPRTCCGVTSPAATLSNRPLCLRLNGRSQPLAAPAEFGCDGGTNLLASTSSPLGNQRIYSTS